MVFLHLDLQTDSQETIFGVTRHRLLMDLLALFLSYLVHQCLIDDDKHQAYESSDTAVVQEFQTYLYIEHRKC